ncbi:hypothetical protein [Synechococcus sp. PCC 6312]|uniref:hypothetical protein n=1 Tax=Synechococcus sp. (strain ATCC 27167 / PCC 6312) TaxID=195253 RepID=UPI00029EF7A9|nr:hypothetical protein [Synechococcus sp. PCC 6312]AFY60664.1 hypothetical protein Syn6312_1500 [Synechococcus sp. PCC 6312]
MSIFPTNRGSRFWLRHHGLTMAEALVAVIITNALIAFLPPVVLMLQATRVQNERIEQATTVAQGEIDDVGVKVATLSSDTTLFTTDAAFRAVLPPTVTGSLDAQAPPTSIQNCSGMPSSPSVGCIRTLGRHEYVVQQFRTSGVARRDFSNFDMQVRVYSRRLWQGMGGPVTTDPATPLTAALTASPEASRRALVVLTTNIIKGSFCQATDTSTSDLRCLIQEPSPSPSPSP